MKLFFDGFGDEKATSQLTSSLAYPLVREIVFKYNLLVITHTTEGWLMGNKDGFAVGIARAFHNSKGVVEYSWRSPYYRKERGSNNADKETIRSAKVASLMHTLKTKIVIPNVDTVYERNVVKRLPSAAHYLERAMGGTSKPVDLKGDDIHALLAFYLHGEIDSRGLSLDRTECKNLLDKYDEVDDNRRMKREKYATFFGNPFYMIGVDGLRNYIIGKLQAPPENEANNRLWRLVVLEPFKRYKSIEDYPNLIPFITMTKTAMEGRGYSMYGGLPLTDKYDDSLDAVFFYDATPGAFDLTYAVTPC